MEQSPRLPRAHDFSEIARLTAQLDGLRIITPSRTAWPPIAVLI
jgi:hypothetical protein